MREQPNEAAKTFFQEACICSSKQTLVCSLFFFPLQFQQNYLHCGRPEALNPLISVNFCKIENTAQLLPLTSWWLF